MASETIRLFDPSGPNHIITVSVAAGIESIQLCAVYQEGDLLLANGATVANWPAYFEPPIPDVDPGSASIGDGRIDLEMAPLRGIGLGSLLMRPLILWIKVHDNVPVTPIDLSSDDALTDTARRIRNRFYEKLGFEFRYKDDETWGSSKAMTSHSLITPEVRLSAGWKLDSILNAGSVF